MSYYFLFSKEQMDLRKKVESQINRTYIPGKVIVQGRERMYTEITEDSNSRFKDSIIILEVQDLDNVRYTEPKVISRV